MASFGVSEGGVEGFRREVRANLERELREIADGASEVRCGRETGRCALHDGAAGAMVEAEAAK